ncbi:MAG: flavin reductase [Clostridia bacterium]|nr:flavin reductase [Clostridia bacterium]
MKVTKDIFYVGVNDHITDLFEGQYIVPNGMAYNSYVVVDDKITVFDTVDARFTDEWFDNIAEVLGDRKPDYLLVQHMEPDHSANIKNFIKAYPDATIIGNEKTFKFMEQFFGTDFENKLVVKDGETLCTGRHTFTFVFAPMVHWPEVMMTYDSCDKVLFSADGFGKFGALDVDEEWACEARRYYIGIVGKYGMQVQTVLKKAAALDIQIICPLHGPVLTENLGYYISLYDTWSSYRPESKGVLIAYTSIYGNTKKAVDLIADKLKANGCPAVAIQDLARCDMAEAIEDAFRYDTMVLATTTYNNELFPFMKTFVDGLTERNYQNRTVGIIENGTWAPNVAKNIKAAFEKSKNITFAENIVSIKSAVNDDNKAQIEALAKELCANYSGLENMKVAELDSKALFNIGYGLYVVTSNDGKKDNALIVNTVAQVTNTPERITVAINKDNYSHHIIKKTGKLNVNCLSVDAPFKVFEDFGFKSGRAVDKFTETPYTEIRSENGLRIIPDFINAYMSLEVEDYVDLGTHGMFICSVTESKVINNRETMTYTYYQKNVKPKPKTEGKKGYVCKICGYVYEGDPLPEDFICPLCKHGASDFEPIK